MKSPRTRFGRILVAVDGSESAQRAVDAAIELSDLLSSELTILHVIEIPVTPSLSDKPIEIDVEQVSEEMRTRGEKMAVGAASLAKARGVKAVRKVITHMGSATEGITDFAEKNGIDLIVIGTRGLSGLQRLLLGSAAGGTVEYAHCSVLVVR